MKTRSLALSFGLAAMMSVLVSAQDVPRVGAPGTSKSPGTTVKVKFLEQITSAEAKNGQNLRGEIAEAVSVEGRALAVGTPVKAAVVSAAKAGQLLSEGEISLQIESVGDEDLLSDVLVVLGEEGKKDLPDSAAAKGTEAMVKSNSVLTFKIVPAGLANREPVNQSNIKEAMAVGAYLAALT